ncbi:Heat shock 70 kDa protein 12A [Physocladia obscura]|uniref:Heat shock 70 kDa protein 12A n=1 Tax=Physocladia obscura TaxID=109957 RepID=A0AAD5XF43_9FUNG|nr:Heat shock 70 kDa protein 12A [Physocladia obscura]
MLTAVFPNSLAYSFKTRIFDPEYEINVFYTWPLAGVGKTASAILIKDGKCVSFGSKAVENVSTLKTKDRKEYIYLSHLKRVLYAEENIKDRTNLTDTVSGKSILAIDVIRLCLTQVKNVFLEEANNKGHSIFSKDVLWVVTVPAIWKESAKKLILLAAESTGIKNLRIVLESKAASVWVLSLTKSHKADSLKKGDLFIVANCGGGSIIDVTVHELTSGTDSTVKEIVKASGGDWGSTVIDRAFYQMMDDIFGVDKMDTFRKDMAQFAQMQDVWEKKKCSYDGESDVLIYIASLKETAEEDIENYNAQNGTDLELDNTNLVIPAGAMQKLYAGAINTTISHLQTILKKGVAPKCIMLVGNFANSQLLQDATRKSFEPSVRVVVPPFPGNCVVSGAVLYTCKPSFISERLSKYAYGVDVCPLYDESKGHTPDKKVFRNGEWRCNDVMSWIVKLGDSIPHGKPFSRLYFPINENQKCISFDIFSGTQDDILFCTDRGCKKLGEIKSPDADPELLKDKGVKFLMLFDTEIHVRCIGPNGNVTSAALTFTE